MQDRLHADPRYAGNLLLAHADCAGGRWGRVVPCKVWNLSLCEPLLGQGAAQSITCRDNVVHFFSGFQELPRDGRTLVRA